MHLTILTVNDEGDEVEIKIPAKWEICSHCQGEGVSSSYLGAFTREEMEAEGPEFMEDYFEGKYDRPCPMECYEGKLKVPDWDRMTEEQKTIWQKHFDDEREYNQMSYLERMMGA